MATFLQPISHDLQEHGVGMGLTHISSLIPLKRFECLQSNNVNMSVRFPSLWMIMGPQTSILPLPPPPPLERFASHSCYYSARRPPRCQWRAWRDSRGISCNTIEYIGSNISYSVYAARFTIFATVANSQYAY